MTRLFWVKDWENGAVMHRPWNWTWRLQTSHWIYLANPEACINMLLRFKVKEKSEDDLAFLRDDQEYRNCLIVELPNGDFGKTIMRQYLFDEYQLGLYEKLTDSADEQLAAIAQKSLKETIYHRRLSREWVKRLGDGTEESHRRIQNGLNELWSYTGSMFVETEADKALRISGITFDMAPIKARWDQEISQTLSEATLIKPEGTWMHDGGRGSVHTEHLGTMLAEMQVLQRSYPGLEW